MSTAEEKVRDAPEFSLREVAGVRFVSSALLEGAEGLRHMFLTRDAGEEPDWSALGLPRAPVRIRQVHGDGIVFVEEENAARLSAAPTEGDALVTTLRNVPLAVFTADCVSAVIFDRETRAVGVVHAGWRGTVRSILWKTVLAMFERLGTRPENCVAATGPAIAAPCYEVGEDVREAFVKGLPYGQDVLTESGRFRWLLNLGEANRRQLLDGLVPARQAAVCPHCTHCEEGLFHSARRERGAKGRQATVAWLT